MPPQTSESRKSRKKLPTSRHMVDEVLTALHGTKGITMKRMHSYIMDKYQIAITPQRQWHIKKHLTELKANGIVNKTEKGFKLVHKNQYEHQLKIASGKTRRSHRNVQSQAATTDDAPTVSPRGRSDAANININSNVHTPESMQFSQSYSDSETLAEEEMEDMIVSGSSKSPSIQLVRKRKGRDVIAVDEDMFPQPSDAGTPSSSFPRRSRRLQEKQALEDYEIR